MTAPSDSELSEDDIRRLMAYAGMRPHFPPIEEYKQLKAEVEQLRADAARWRYVRDNHSYHTLVMNRSTGGCDSVWRLEFYGAGNSITEVIDKLIAEEREAIQDAT